MNESGNVYDSVQLQFLDQINEGEGMRASLAQNKITNGKSDPEIRVII